MLFTSLHTCVLIVYPEILKYGITLQCAMQIYYCALQCHVLVTLQDILHICTNTAIAQSSECTCLH